MTLALLYRELISHQVDHVQGRLLADVDVPAGVVQASGRARGTLSALLRASGRRRGRASSPAAKSADR
jgi:hypothetical protein